MRAVLQLLTGILLTTPAFGKATQIIIAGDNWCPINCSASATDKGYMIDVASQALAMAGYELVYQEMPWARAIALARRGAIHGIVGAFKGDAPDFYFPANAILNISPNHLFTLKDSSWRYSGPASWGNVRLGTIIGYDYGEELNNYLITVTPPLTHEVKQLSGDDAVKRSIEFLLKRRTDVLVESAPVLWYHANQLGVADQLQEAGVISAPEPCFIAFSPSRPESAQLSHALDAGITLMKQQNALLPIAKRYGLSSALAPVVPLPD
ncbi:transporter substrate-binding domain-containing protein [Arsukibacterium sp.]|uniref:substrate-binding periplasmic protein n=1 Tax=Arsukibacterium sp. TaxID=1977258 RepID=UPI00299D60E8|nr:transporter substrate-binding domain-containing protein [Arsukibacterium sp.]MDX1537199.1 transporter substrate-binding domain-containing protein [Arsukibacterium sp.]